MAVPDWKLPPGVDRGLWDYVTSPEQAAGYDAALAGTPLLEYDLAFCDRWLNAPGPTLDLGCGTGRLALRLAAAGRECVGLDLSEPMLRELGAKAAAAGVGVPRWRANLVELDAVRDGAFGNAACLFSTLGMLRGREARRRCLAEAFRVLAPGGRFVVHAHNRDYHLIAPYGRRWWLRDLWRRATGSPLSGDRTMPAPRAGAELTLHHFTRREILRELKGAGFAALRVEALPHDRAGPLAGAWLERVRAYGWLIAAEKEAS